MVIRDHLEVRDGLIGLEFKGYEKKKKITSMVLVSFQLNHHQKDSMKVQI